jgi:zinc protease
MIGEHPYARDEKGSLDSVKALTPQDLRKAWSQLFARDRSAGRGRWRHHGRRTGQVPGRGVRFAACRRNPRPITVPDVKFPEKGSITIVERDIPQSVMSFAMPGLVRSDPDFIAAYVMNFVLGDGGFGSRLMEEIREKRGLTYGIYTGLAAFENAGFLFGSVSTQNARVGETLSVLRAELKRMAETGPTEKELEEAKTYLTGSYALRFDSSSKIAGQLLGIQQQDLGIDYVEKRNDLIRAVTVEDAKRAAKRLIDPSRLTISIVGRPEGIPLKTGEPG